MPETPEQLARQQIDSLFVASGWVVQDYKQFNPTEGRGIALREAPLKSGTCDYHLLVDRKAVGVAEAKKQGTLLSGVAEQSGHYAENLPDMIQSVAPGSLPFLYESTGVETFFRDERDPAPRSRRVFSFIVRKHSPHGLPNRTPCAPGWRLCPRPALYAPFSQQGGLGKTHQFFGGQRPALLDELNTNLAA
jgi:type I site-specific restriction endonuclease